MYRSRHRPQTGEVRLRKVLPVLGYRRQASAFIVVLKAEPTPAELRIHHIGDTRRDVEDHPFSVVGEKESADHRHTVLRGLAFVFKSEPHVVDARDEAGGHSRKRPGPKVYDPDSVTPSPWPPGVLFQQPSSARTLPQTL